MKHLGENRTTVKRGWWLIGLILSLTCCFYLIYLIYDKWENNPTIMSFVNEETPINQIPFPAVTICPVVKSYSHNQTKIIEKLIHYRSLNETEYKSFSYMNLFCDQFPPPNDWFVNKSENFSFNDNFFNQQEFYNFTLNITDIHPLISCSWRNRILFHCLDLIDIILTDDGVCYSFNLLSPKNIYKDNVQNYFFDRINHRYSRESNRGTYARRASFSGVSQSLDIGLYVNNNFNDPLCRFFWSLQGFKVILHTPSTVPRLRQEHFYLPANTAVIAAIKPVVVSTSENFKKFSPEKRNCYFENENPLRYFKEYTQSNCELDCLTRYTLYWCRCVAFYMPMDNITTICSSLNRKCLHEAEEIMFSNKLIINPNANADEKPPQCHCLPSCRDLSYEVETSSIKYKPVILSKFDDSGRNYSYSRLVIYFKRNHFTASNRHELYEITEFIGKVFVLLLLLGLFTGFAVLSFMKIFYVLTVRLFNIGSYGQWSGNRDEENNL
ncbi:hypothetical protein ABEB36_012525 [Hypothenemus hampei]|uniref:Sodium channel protein Nach n=1 Tax=Hypothenemus hampei TaxID=57062 RepID=A0ABD1EBI0_HYPHA